MKIKTSYFYQIRHFTSNLIPVSVCLSDPIWFRPPEGKEFYIDKRGIICGLRYEPLIVQKYGTKTCIGEYSICPFVHYQPDYYCEMLQEYRQLLETVDFTKMIKAFEYCLNKFNKDTIVLIVYEAPNNPCSERNSIQELFREHGLEIEEWICG
jgi:hypothetical protein